MAAAVALLAVGYGLVACGQARAEQFLDDMSHHDILGGDTDT